jgi:hypothetical protein
VREWVAGAGAVVLTIVTARRLRAETVPDRRFDVGFFTALAMLVIGVRTLLLSDGTEAHPLVWPFGTVCAACVALLAGTSGHPARFFDWEQRRKYFGAVRRQRGPVRRGPSGRVKREPRPAPRKGTRAVVVQLRVIALFAVLELVVAVVAGG